MKLRDMSPDQILEELETRADNYADAYELEQNDKARHESLCVAMYQQFREGTADTSGMSQGDAERAYKSTQAYLESHKNLVMAQTDCLRAKMRLERARAAKDLYQTERADARRVQ